MDGFPGPASIERCSQMLVPISDAQGGYYTSINKNLIGSEAQRQVDLFVKSNDENVLNTVHNWKDVEVIGEFRESDKNWKANLLQLSRCYGSFRAKPIGLALCI